MPFTVIITHICRCSTEDCRTSRLPVFYALPESTVDLRALDEAVSNSELISSEDKLLVLCNLCHEKDLEDITDMLLPRYQALVVGRSEVNKSSSDVSVAKANFLSGRVLPSLDLADYKILFIGEDSPFLTQVLMTINRNPCIRYDPQTACLNLESSSMNKRLTKRFLMAEKVKEAQVIGILVGTLAVSSYVNVINDIRDLIESTGRQACIIVVGKLNEAKLANFPEIEVFVNVACPQNTLVESKDFFQPIVTPFELLVALRDDVWDAARYTLDFSQLLSALKSRDIQNGGLLNENSEDEAPVYSLASGKYVKKNRRRQEAVVDVETQELIKMQSGELIISELADTLAYRTWTGLDISEPEKPAELAVEGRSGVASGYANEDSI